MTDSKLIPLDAMANAAIQQSVQSQGGPDPLAEFSRVLSQPARSAGALVAPASLKAPKTTDARSPATLQRAALATLVASGDPDETAMLRALERAGVTKEMLPQMLESPDWAAVVARICQQYLYTFNLPGITAAQITKAKLGDTAAAKYLAECFGKSDLDQLDEQTRALSEADPQTRLRHTKMLVEDLQRFIAEVEGKAADTKKVEAARKAAIAETNSRRKAT